MITLGYRRGFICPPSSYLSKLLGIPARSPRHALSPVQQQLSIANTHLHQTHHIRPENRICAFFAVLLFFFLLQISVPDAPRPVCGEHRLRLDPLDPILPHLDPLRQIPKEKVDQHAAHPRARTPVRAQRSRDAFHSDDRRGADGHLFPRGVDPVGATGKLDARFEQADE